MLNWSVISIVLGPLCYFAGVQHSKRNQKEKLIQKIADKYLSLRDMAVSKATHDIAHNYPDILIKAGILTLEKTKDKKEVINRIMKHGEQSPMFGYKEHIKNDIDLENALNQFAEEQKKE